MPGKVKAVIDTNVWVSALIADGNPRAIADALDANQFTLFSSNELLDELTRVLSRPRLAALMPEERKDRLLAMVMEKASLVELGQITSISPSYLLAMSPGSKLMSAVRF